jgi:uncharacterized protein YjbI with pentapeptide repeats
MGHSRQPDRLSTLSVMIPLRLDSGQRTGESSMANKKALELLKHEEVKEFNKWVKERRGKGKDSVDLDDQNLGGLKLRNVDLSNAHLNGAILRKTDLKGANLARARLRQADLRGANLEGADLTGADLRRAKKKGAVWKKATLKDAKGMDG